MHPLNSESRRKTSIFQAKAKHALQHSKTTDERSANHTPGGSLHGHSSALGGGSCGRRTTLCSTLSSRLVRVALGGIAGESSGEDIGVVAAGRWYGVGDRGGELDIGTLGTLAYRR